MRNIRMEQAARLLREGRLSVAEIAEQCGFQSPGYFSRLFQQTYGMKPSEYARSQA
jgi:AraC-like DNA-binding protein